ncbi:hypothetical protein R6Q57_020664 [Mikania cordata]
MRVQSFEAPSAPDPDAAFDFSSQGMGCKRRLSRLKAGVSFLTIPRSSFIPPAFLSLFRKFRARSVADEQVRIASTKIDGIGPKKAILVRYRLGALRSAAQMVPYEVSIGLILIVRLVSAFGSAKEIARMFP